MKRGAVIGIVGGAVALAAVAAVGVWWFASRPQTPDAAARAYLDALESGDYAAVEQLLDRPVDDHVETAFASAEAYAEDARVLTIDDAVDGQAQVKAEAEFDGMPHSLTFVLTRSAGGWKLAPESLAAVRIEATLDGAAGAGDSVWIGEALVPVGADVALLPAAYEVVAAPRGILSGSAIATVADRVSTVTLETALAPDATSIAQERLNAYLDACAAPATEVPAHCGIRVPWAADLASLGEITFRIDEYPVLALSADGTAFDATGGVIVATASGDSRAGGTASFTYRSEDWAVRGEMEFTGDELVLSVR